MKRQIFSIAAAVVLVFAGMASGQADAVRKADLDPAEVNRIIQKFSDNEHLFREALNVYAFNRYASMSTVGMGGQITGTYRRDSFMTFTDAGERFERIIFSPVSTLTELSVSPEDINNVGGIDPFAIEPKKIPEYNFTYLGKEKIDELDLYVFDVAPKVKPDPKKGLARYFQGRIWVDDADLMIVRSRGKAVPEGKQRFPVVETTRENVDGKYWFPAYSSSDDTLYFDNGMAVRLRFRVKYTDYRVGRSNVRILDDEPETPAPKPSPSPSPVKKP